MIGASSPVIDRSASPTGGVKRAHVIILGNEKGGSGKTTTCMHLVVALMRLGFSVGTIDTDSRQRSLSRYIENRRQTATREGVALPVPHHVVVQKSPFNVVEEANADERDRFFKAMARLLPTNDFVIIDSPGNDTYLSRLAHSFSDTIITPINDSFVDLDVLATVDGSTLQVVRPSIYSEMIWEQKLERAKRDGGAIEWIVMRNRLSNIDAKNKRFMTQVTSDLARRLGFRVAPGFSERVIFREMFLQGLTVLDVMDAGSMSISMSHIAARQEVRDLLKTLRLAQVDARLEEKRGVIVPEPKKIEEEEAEQASATAAADALSSRVESALQAFANGKPEVKEEDSAQPEAKAEPKLQAAAVMASAPVPGTAVVAASPETVSAPVAAAAAPQTAGPAAAVVAPVIPVLSSALASAGTAVAAPAVVRPTPVLASVSPRPSSSVLPPATTSAPGYGAAAPSPVLSSKPVVSPSVIPPIQPLAAASPVVANNPAQSDTARLFAPKKQDEPTELAS